MTEKYFVYIPNPVRKSVKKIPQPWQKRILDILTILETDPFIGEKMTGRLEYYRKIRIWPYRVIYSISKNDNIIKIVEIEHRGNVSYN